MGAAGRSGRHRTTGSASDRSASRTRRAANWCFDDGGDLGAQTRSWAVFRWARGRSTRHRVWCRHWGFRGEPAQDWSPAVAMIRTARSTSVTRRSPPRHQPAPCRRHLGLAPVPTRHRLPNPHHPSGPLHRLHPARRTPAGPNTATRRRHPPTRHPHHPTQLHRPQRLAAMTPPSSARVPCRHRPTTKPRVGAPIPSRSQPQGSSTTPSVSAHRW